MTVTDVVVPILLVLLIIGFLFAVNKGEVRRLIRRSGSVDEAAADNTDTIPLPHVAGEESRPLGDTDDAHDEITPHDLPLEHPGRADALAQAGSHAGVTEGDEHPSEARSPSERPAV